MRSIKDECLSKLILLDEVSLRRAAAELTKYYHHERNHQGKENMLLFLASGSRRRSRPKAPVIPHDRQRGSRQLKGRKAALVLVAVEKRGRATGCARMAIIPDFKNTTLIAFVKQNVAPGTTVYTDGLKTFSGLREAGFKHVTRSQSLRIELR